VNKLQNKVIKSLHTGLGIEILFYGTLCCNLVIYLEGSFIYQFRIKLFKE